MLGRIPPALIDEIRVKANLVEWVQTHVKLKKSGAQWVACCPFHHEKTPSFFVNPVKQRYRCFGCGKQGDIIQFLIDQGMSFQDAVTQLAERLGLSAQLNEALHTADPALEQLQPIYKLLNKATVFYMKQFKAHPKGRVAIDYLKNRGITGITAKRFRLGYAPPGWHNLQKIISPTEDQGEYLEIGLKSGLLTVSAQGGTPYDRFRERILFPISDLRGRILGFGGRVLDDSKPKYLNSPETPVFHKSQIVYGLYEAKQANPHGLVDLLVVEGYFDVVSLSQAGITRVVATLGTALTNHHIDILFQHTDDILFGFDGDNAGQDAAWKALLLCLPHLKDGRRVGFVFFPKGEDPDSFLKKAGLQAFSTQLERRRSLPDFLFETLARGVDLTQIDGRAKLVSLGKSLLSQLPPGAFQQMMLNRLAEVSGLSPRQLAPQVITFSTPPARAAYSPRQKKSRGNLSVSSLVLRLIALLSKNKDFIPDFQQLNWSAATLSPAYAYLALLQEQLREKNHRLSEALVACHAHYPTVISMEQLQEQINAIPDIDLHAEWQGLLQKLLKQQIDQETDYWLKKAKQGEKLSMAEMNHLNSLLRQPQDETPKS
jgi:DNA primase